MAPASDADDYVPSDVESGDAGASGHGSVRDDPDMEPYQRDLGRETYTSEEAGASPSSSASSPSRKRHAHHLQSYAGAPLKRQRRAFNADYLGLLNEDIADASVSLVADDDLDLKASQVGAVQWSPVEKTVFFAALDRLGRDDLPGIAGRIGSKSPLEVRQLVMLLDERTVRRQGDRELRRKTPRPAEIPAAVEIGHECAAALEGAADDLALRQENYGVAAEEVRWGDRWLVTKKLSEHVDRTGEQEEDDQMPFLDFFHVRTWLKLSEKLFMNSVIPDYSWRYVSEEPPAIRATALSDFHGLVASITKRLVASTLFMAGMRIKLHKGYMPSTKNLVKARDVQAAVDSLNMKHSSQDFWARAPRRLRLDVYQDEVKSAHEGSEDEDSQEERTMSYDDVEATLGVVKTANMAGPPTDDAALDVDEQTDDSDSGLSVLEDDELAEETGEEGDTKIDTALDQEGIKRDMREAMYFSADYEFTTRARQGLQGRLEAEYRMEADAEEHDAQASRQEEARLWSVLRKTDALVEAPIHDEELKPWVRTTALEPAAKNWRDGLQYVSHWETIDRKMDPR